MNTGNWWWDTQDQRPAGVTIVPVICASDMLHMINFSGDQHAWLLYLTICQIQNDIRLTPRRSSSILVGLISSPAKSARNIEEA
jgi:hypothetical protein